MITLLAKSGHEFTFEERYLYSRYSPIKEENAFLLVLDKNVEIKSNESRVTPKGLCGFNFIKYNVGGGWTNLPAKQYCGEGKDCIWLGWGDEEAINADLKRLEIEPISSTSVMDSLEFYVPIWNNGKIELYNIFRSSRIRKSLATYRAGWMEEIGHKDWCKWVFGDTWGRVEWEFGFGAPFENKDGTWDAAKQDVYTLFIEPNKEILKKMVDSVPLQECVDYKFN